MITVSSDQGRAHAAPVAPELGLTDLGRTVAKPVSSFANRTTHRAFGVAGRSMGRAIRLRRSRPRRGSVDALSEDRRRIAADVHDLIMQDLSFAVATARSLADDPTSAPQASMVLAAGERALAGAREVVQGLVVEADNAPPIVEAVEASVRAAARNASVTFDARHVSVCAQPDRLTREALVHIAREAVTNAIKHGGRHTEVEVVLEHDEEWRLSVRDTGPGFEPSVAPAGFGLESMRAGAQHLGGSLRLWSVPGKGSTVEAILP